MPLSPDAVLKDIHNNKYSPVYFLQGDEPFYIDLIAGEIEKKCLQESEKSFNQTIVYGKEISISTILQHAKKFPMMAERQVVIIKEAQDINDFGKDAADKMLDAYIQNPLPSTVLVFCYKYKTLDARKSISKSIDKYCVLVTSKKLYDDKLPDWVASYFSARQLKISPKAATILAENIGNNLSRLANEIEKLLINVKSGGEIDEALIEKYIGISKEYNVFELQKALTRRDVLKSNQIINYFESDPKNNPLIPILTILFGFFSKILMVHHSEDKSEAGISRLLKVNPFFAKDYIIASRSYSDKKTISIIHYLRLADLSSKGVDNNSSTEGQILKELIFKILH